jgi:uncharacterized membrane protein YgcG
MRGSERSVIRDGSAGKRECRVGRLVLVLLVIVVVAAVLGVVISRRNKARRRVGDDPATRARAAGAQLSRETRVRQWRNKSHGGNDYSGGGRGCGGGGGGCAGGE